jgi:hypothetical protein
MEVKKFADLNLYLKGFEIESIGIMPLEKYKKKIAKKEYR